MRRPDDAGVAAPQPPEAVPEEGAAQREVESGGKADGGRDVGEPGGVEPELCGHVDAERQHGFQAVVEHVLADDVHHLEEGEEEHGLQEVGEVGAEEEPGQVEDEEGGAGHAPPPHPFVTATPPHPAAEVPEARRRPPIPGQVVHVAELAQLLHHARRDPQRTHLRL